MVDFTLPNCVSVLSVRRVDVVLGENGGSERV